MIFISMNSANMSEAPKLKGSATFSVTTLSIMTLSIMTPSIMTLSIMTLSIMTLSLLTFSIMTHNTKSLFVTLGINYTQHERLSE